MKQQTIWGTLDPFVEGGGVMGRKVANGGFLSALLEADPFDQYHFFLESPAALARQEEWLKDGFPALRRRGAFVLRAHQELHTALARTRYHCFHLSDCLSRFTALARLRNLYSPHIFPITGPTHSLSYDRFMPAFLGHLWKGVSPRDAIAATSKSAEDALRNVFGGLRAAYGVRGGAGTPRPAGEEGVEHENGGRPLPGPRVERIPLGVVLEGLPSPEERWDAPLSPANLPARDLRKRLDLGGALMFLCLGRLDPASKMDVTPVLAALKRAEDLGLAPGSHALVLAGWAEEGDPLPEALRGYARALGLRLIPVPRPDDAERRALYAAADVFLSPADNVQETFGLTLAEAGAAGLPVIASDFDGYRDIVVHGETGLLAPTLGFAETAETAALAGLWFDNQYHLRLAQQTVVDVPALAGALVALGTDPARRKAMGAAAAQRVRERFSWPVVIRRYVELWDALARVPLEKEAEAALRAAAHPLRMDFARVFRGHFTGVLDGETAASLRLRRTAAGDALYRKALPPLLYAGMEHMLDDGMLRRILLAARKPASARELLDAALAEMLGAAPAGRESEGEETRIHPAMALPPAVARERAAFALLWALKRDYLELA